MNSLLCLHRTNAFTPRWRQLGHWVRASSDVRFEDDAERCRSCDDVKILVQGLRMFQVVLNERAPRGPTIRCSYDLEKSTINKANATYQKKKKKNRYFYQA